MEIRAPQSEQEWESYFQLRWQILRAPWNQEKGSEQDKLEFDKTTFHAMSIDQNKIVYGVARLHLLPENTAQIRYMAVSEQHRGMGIGNQLMYYLEGIAQQKSVTKIILQARQNALNFYLKQNYNVVQKSFVMYNEVQHYLMEKHL